MPVPKVVNQPTNRHPRKSSPIMAIQGSVNLQEDCNFQNQTVTMASVESLSGGSRVAIRIAFCISISAFSVIAAAVEVTT